MIWRVEQRAAFSRMTPVAAATAGNACCEARKARILSGGAYGSREPFGDKARACGNVGFHWVGSRRNRVGLAKAPPTRTRRTCARTSIHCAHMSRSSITRIAHVATSAAPGRAPAKVREPLPSRGGKPHAIRIIGGDWKRTPLPVLDLDGLRPTPDRVRETLFNWLGQQLDGQRCLDLFAGSGALGFEAASRGAARVLMVERSGRAVAQLKANQARLAAKNDRNRRSRRAAPRREPRTEFLRRRLPRPAFRRQTMLERALELAAPLRAARRRALRRIGRGARRVAQTPALAGLAHRARRQGGRGPLSFAAARK